MNTKKIILTKDQEKFIDENWRDHTHEQMAVRLGLSVNIVSNYCTGNGYKKINRAKKGEKRIVEKRRINLGPIERKIKHPPPDHTNISREQHVEKWLNVQI